MITNLILDLLFYVPNLLLENIPNFELSIPEGVFNGLSHICAFIGWFPIRQILPILGASIVLSFNRAVWALIIRIKSFIPTMGD